MFKILNIKDEYRHYLLNIFGLKIRISKKGYFQNNNTTTLAGKKIYKQKAADDLIYERLSENKPLFIARFGATELTTVDYFYKYNRNNFVEFPDFIKNDMKTNPGFFTPSDKHLNRFCKEFLELIPNIDILAVWNFQRKNLTSEEFYIKNFMKNNSELVNLWALSENTLMMEKPWTRILKDKKVLVIHPFKDTILSQYEKRHLLFNSSYHLPDCEFKVIKAVQGLNTKDAIQQYGDWFNALESMYKEIDETDFDIAIIGAGAFGIFLGNYIKNKGKKALHIGGGTQLLFGIKGSRWEKWACDNYWNEHWVKPSENETIKTLSLFEKNEGGRAYW